MSDAKQLQALDDALTRIEMLIGDAEALGRHVPEVSGWSVARQVDHTLQSLRHMTAAIDVLRRGDDERIQLSGRPSATARMIMIAGKIPRGRAQAPEHVLPEEAPDVDALRALLAKSRASLEALEPQLPAIRSWKGRMPHPLLGPFRAHHWLRFARVHTDHHLAIVDDILAAL